MVNPRNKSKKKKQSKSGKTEMSMVTQTVPRRMEIVRKIYSKASNSIVIKNREYIQDISTNMVAAYRIAPGCDNLYWLDSISNSFEFYRFIKLRFSWVPTCPVTAGGNVVIAPEYDTTDEIPRADSIRSFAYNKSGPPYAEMNIDVDVSKFALRKYFTRLVSQTVAQEERFQIPVRFCIDTSNFSGSASGQVVVEYEVELSVPQLPDIHDELKAQYIGTIADNGTNGIFNKMSPTDLISHTTDLLDGVYIDTSGGIANGAVFFNKPGTYSVSAGAQSAATGGNLMKWYDSAGLVATQLFATTATSAVAAFTKEITKAMITAGTNWLIPKTAAAWGNIVDPYIGVLKAAGMHKTTVV